MKINRITTLILLVLWLLLVWRFFLVPPKREIILLPEMGGEKAVAEKDEAAQPDEIKIYSSIIERLKAPFDITRYKQLFVRNIFVKPEKPVAIFTPENLKLLAVDQVVLPFMYNGYILVANGAIIGQVNWGEKTYFLKKGERFKDYTVIDIQPRRLIVEGKDGELVLDLKIPSKGKELVAKLYNELDGKTYEVKKGDAVNGYKILDITTGSVIVYGQNREWVIKKETT